MKYALIGCGRISPNHIMAAVNNGLEIVALCDSDMSHACAKSDLASEALAKAKAEGKYPAEAPNPLCFGDYEEMLSQVRPDLLAIATPSGMHAEMAVAGLEAGAHVIIEKPMALSLRDADRIIETSKRTGLKVSCCHQNRFNKSIVGIREALEAGRFGRLHYATAHVRWHRDERYYSLDEWRGTWAQDGGVLMNQCIHAIDLLRWMLGDEIDEIFSITDNLDHPYIEAEDLGLALIRTNNGAYGLLEGTSLVYPQNLEETLYLFGERATVKAGGKSMNAIEVWNFADAKAEEEAEVLKRFAETPPNIYGFGHTPLYADMLEAINNDRAPRVDMYTGRRALEAVLAMYLSSAGHMPVSLPLQENVATTDFVGSFS